MKHWVLLAAAFASAEAAPQASVEALAATIDTVTVLNERIEAELEFVDLSRGGKAIRGPSGHPVKLAPSLYLSMFTLQDSRNDPRCCAWTAARNDSGWD
ncbi:MAG: hypothetical protein JNL98_04345 [Bryobacterales bacterium]|nr:hypothetical protein [Bryobacterales bacterium]